MPGAPGTPKLVTPEVELAVVEFARTMTTAATIADAVNAKFGTSLARRTIAKILERTRSERSDISKNIAREILSKTVCSDLEVLFEIRERLRALSDAAYDKAVATHEPGDAAEYRKNAVALMTVTKERLHFAGADTPDAPADELKAATQRLHGRLDRLASAARAEGEAPGDSPDSSR